MREIFLHIERRPLPHTRWRPPAVPPSPAYKSEAVDLTRIHPRPCNFSSERELLAKLLYPEMHESVLFIVALALALRSANAHANGLSAEVCETFGVHHSSDRSEDPTKDVWLELIEEDGNVTDCFLPQREYWGELKTAEIPCSLHESL